MANVHTQILGGRGGARKGMVVLSVTIPNAAAAVDQNVFVADQAYMLVSAQEVHTVVGGSGSALAITKCTGTQAPSAGVHMLEDALFALTLSINTVRAQPVDLEILSTQLVAGDRIGFDFAGTIGGLAGMVVTLVLIPITARTGAPVTGLNDTGDRRYWLSDV